MVLVMVYKGLFLVSCTGLFYRSPVILLPSSFFALVLELFFQGQARIASLFI